ncbi:MAG: D-Ala-D-Ala carboxypeptidase family metallohydrolase [Chitinophagaceae bacterium]|jgi:uncharacterized protein YcbK (DUF882 family)
MIIGIEKIAPCDMQVKDLVGWLYERYHNIVITSGFRTPAANEAIKNSSKVSQHCLGLAVDLAAPGHNLIVLAGLAITNFPAIHGVGQDVYKKYVHLDFRVDPYREWVYGKDGKEC